MARRKPNGYGSITKLKGRRSKPYMIRVTKYDSEGNARQVAIGYAETEAEAMQILASYNQSPWSVDRNIKLYELYNKWLEVKANNLGSSNKQRLQAGFKHCEALYGMRYIDIKTYHMQKCIDDCPLSRESKASIQNLFGHLDRFAFEMDIINKMNSQILVNNAPIKETTKSPFTLEEKQKLWEHSDNRDVQIALIYMYSGFRLNELLNLRKEDYDTVEKTLKGGSKTRSGKNRIVPIHSKIQAYVDKFYQEDGEYLITTVKHSQFSSYQYYKSWERAMKLAGISNKFPHEVRHTIETELDNKHANKKCIDLIMGHSSQDVGTRIYNHKTLEQLRETIELLE